MRSQRSKPTGVDGGEGDARCPFQDGDQVGAGLLEEVDLTFLERCGGGGGVRDGEPFDAVDFGDLAAGQAVGRFNCGAGTVGRTRLVGGVAVVDGVMAGLEFGSIEDVGAGAGGVRDGDGGRGVGEAFRHDEQGGCGGTGEGLGDQGERAGQDEGEGMVVGCVQAGGGGHEGLADDVTLCPALDAGDGVDGADRGVVVEHEAGTKGKVPGAAV